MAAIQLFFSPHLKCIIYNIEDEVCEESLHFYLDFDPGKKKIYIIVLWMYCIQDVHVLTTVGLHSPQLFPTLGLITL